MVSINPIYNINYSLPIAAARQKSSITSPAETMPKVSFKGTEALAAYNYNLVNKNNDFDIPTMEPIEFPDDLMKNGGNPIYDSKGNLVVVKKIIGDKKYVYHNNNAKHIDVFDKNGEKIQEQECFTNLNKEKMLVIRNFVQGKRDVYQTSYVSENGRDFELCDKSKHVYYPDGTSKEFFHYVKEKKYDVIEHSNTNDYAYLFDKSIQYDENKNIKCIVEHSANKDSYKIINYKNGIPYKIEEENSTVVPNKLLTNMEFLNDKDLIPHEKFNILQDAINKDGIKTYYSNGAVESNSFVWNKIEFTYKFKENGDLYNIIYGNKSIEIDKDGYSIIEFLDNNYKKETTYAGNSVYVKVSDKNHDKFVTYRNNKLIEYNIYENGEGTSYIFNPDGSLRECYNSSYEK